MKFCVFRAVRRMEPLGRVQVARIMGSVCRFEPVDENGRPIVDEAAVRCAVQAHFKDSVNLMDFHRRPVQCAVRRGLNISEIEALEACGVRARIVCGRQA